jgi:hypothetical protein
MLAESFTQDADRWKCISDHLKNCKMSWKCIMLDQAHKMMRWKCEFFLFLLSTWWEPVHTTRQLLKNGAKWNRYSDTYWQWISIGNSACKTLQVQLSITISCSNFQIRSSKCSHYTAFELEEKNFCKLPSRTWERRSRADSSETCHKASSPSLA